MSFPSSSQRRLRVLLCALAAAALALAATAGAAGAAPGVTLTHDPDLATNPDVAIAGTGFVSPTPVLAPGEGKIGMYAAQTAVVDGEVVVGEAQQWIRPAAFGGAGNTLLNPDGTFSTELEVDEVFGTAPDEVDCAVVQCYISTWQAHGNPVLDQLFTQSPIYFEPTVAAKPAQGIAATGQTIAVDGGGVSAALIAGNGVNMSQIAIVGGEVKTPSPGSGAARWIRASGAGANQLTANGTFSSDLTLSSTFTSGSETINCALVQCAVAIWPGHTNPTPGSLLAQQNISFAYSPSAIVTPTTNLLETQQVTVSGSGYDPAPAKQGVYVSQVAQVGGSIVFPPPGGGAGMQWVRPGGPTADQTLNPDGSFATAVTVTRTFKDSKGATVDCAVVQCSVITWRAHSNPTPATIYTSAPLSFSPVVKDTPVTPPPSVAPSTPVKKQQLKLGTKAAKLDIVVVRCGSAACSFQKPKRVAVKVGDRKLWLNVTGPKQAAAGKDAKFGVRVNAGVAKQLAGKKVRVKFKVQARSDAGNRSVNVNTLLVGAPR